MRSPVLRKSIALVLLATFTVLVGACGADAENGVRVVSADDGFDILQSPPDGLVVLDVRTPEEFAAGHLEHAVMIDFYEPDFESRIADLDRETPYLLYCRSGNRSGSAREIMENLGFTNVSDVDGGIGAWLEAGHPTVTG